jgi:methyl-accepting chemotaxis protein
MSMRRSIWIHNFQTRLMMRIALYLLFFQIITSLVLYSLGRMSAIMQVHAAGSIFDYAPLMAIVAAGFLAAAFLYDALRLTHRLVGPVLRMKTVLESVAAGEEVALVRLRKEDMFTEVADALNQMLQSLASRGAIALQTGASQNDASHNGGQTTSSASARDAVH